MKNQRNPKFDYDVIKYEDCVDIINQVIGKTIITDKQVKEIHRLSTELGKPSKPSSCGSCNNRALTVLKNYVNKFKEKYKEENEQSKKNNI